MGSEVRGCVRDDFRGGRGEGGGGDLSFIQGATQGFPSCPMFVICSRFDHRRQGQPTNEKRKLVIIDTRSHILLPFIAFEILKIFHPCSAPLGLERSLPVLCKTNQVLRYFLTT